MAQVEKIPAERRLEVVKQLIRYQAIIAISLQDMQFDKVDLDTRKAYFLLFDECVVDMFELFEKLERNFGPKSQVLIQYSSKIIERVLTLQKIWEGHRVGERENV